MKLFKNRKRLYIDQGVKDVIGKDKDIFDWKLLIRDPLNLCTSLPLSHRRCPLLPFKRIVYL
jgi:hypothetical protein